MPVSFPTAHCCKKPNVTLFYITESWYTGDIGSSPGQSGRNETICWHSRSHVR